jgi:hypothetical protein
MQAIDIIANEKKFIPLKFKITKGTTPFVFFSRKHDEIKERFLEENPILRTYNKDSLAGTDEELDLVFDLVVLSENEQETMPYIDYIAAVLELYAMLCLDRNEKASKILQGPPGLGLTSAFIKLVIEQPKLNKKLRSAFIFLAHVMFIDMEYYTSLKKPQNRCYFWQDLIAKKPRKDAKGRVIDMEGDDNDMLTGTQTNWMQGIKPAHAQTLKQKMDSH